MSSNRAANMPHCLTSRKVGLNIEHSLMVSCISIFELELKRTQSPKNFMFTFLMYVNVFYFLKPTMFSRCLQVRLFLIVEETVDKLTS